VCCVFVVSLRVYLQEEDLDDAIESMYARKYSLADFIEPTGAHDQAPQRSAQQGGGDGGASDDDSMPPKLPGAGGSSTSQPSSPSSSSAAWPPRMRSPADMSFVGSIAGLSK
jgi:hypothetical protein